MAHAPPPPPTSYDPDSPNERAPPLPDAPPVRLPGSASAVLQPPLSRRGSGPGLLLVLPGQGPAEDVGRGVLLDPPPVQKWAEEGFCVVGVTWDGKMDMEAGAIRERVRVLVEDLGRGVRALQSHASVDVKDKFGLIVYDDEATTALLSPETSCLPTEIGCIAIFARPADSAAHLQANVPVFTHIPLGGQDSTPYKPSRPSTATYPSCGRAFVVPGAAGYNGPAAALAHTHTLVFLRKHLGGPAFDIEAVWEEHTYWEFERRSVAATMATMVAEPYVNHVPTMTGGMGREQLTAFYRDHFIFANPSDTALQPLSRTIGPDRIVDEFIFSCTHASHIPWLLPHVPATHLPLAIPMAAVVNVRGDRVYHEHIWWDQATALRQVGILPTHLPASVSSRVGGMEEKGIVRLPVAGAECARFLADKMSGRSNEMLDPAWAASSDAVEKT
ncbi:hypothetical protein HIM_06601 [Hirsutella minnesotensis 3608]|uniref:SnoaL-like domain-containing protein n=1 Tax=Hirsutella minnesotensis 3608 TaxID=1043627 RepID=A0A0F7ZTY7_9HYPO|nr:hypothetical protein HIM_06601 [Hirsutella minnesotensis 3608]